MRSPWKPLLILLALGLLAAPGARANTGDVDLFEASEGALAVNAPDGRVNYRYAYGKTSGKPDDEKAILKALAESLDPAVAEPHVVDVFAIDTPEDLKRAEGVAKRLRATLKTLEKSVPAAAKVEVAIIPVPASFARGFAFKDHPTLAEEFAKALRRPTADELRTGVIIGAYRAIASYSTWFSTPGINPLVATGVATFQTAMSFFHSAFSRSMSNVFRLNLVHPGTKPARKSVVFARQQMYSLLISELTRLIVGDPPGFDPQFTWAGQLQIVGLSAAFASLDSLVIGARDAAFLNQPKTFARFLLANFFLLTPWTLLDSAGTFPVLLDLEVYKVRASTFGMLAAYFTIWGGLRYAPNKVAFLLDSVFTPVERAFAKLQRHFGRSCAETLRKR